MKDCPKCGPKPWNHCEDCYRCEGCNEPDNGANGRLCMQVEGVYCDPCWKELIETRIANFSADHEDTPEVVCPWCGCVYRDSFEHGEGVNECEDCGRKYHMARLVEVTYTTSRVE